MLFQTWLRRGKLPPPSPSPSMRLASRRFWRLGRRRLWRHPLPTQPSHPSLAFWIPPVNSCPFSEPRMHQNAGFCITNICFSEGRDRLTPAAGLETPTIPTSVPAAQSWYPSASFRLATASYPATQGLPSSASFTDPVTTFLALLQAFSMPVLNPPKPAGPKLRSN